VHEGQPSLRTLRCVNCVQFCDEVEDSTAAVGRVWKHLCIEPFNRLKIEPRRLFRKEQPEEITQEPLQQRLESLVVVHCGRLSVVGDPFSMNKNQSPVA